MTHECQWPTGNTGRHRNCRVMPTVHTETGRSYCAGHANMVTGLRVWLAGYALENAKRLKLPTVALLR